MTRRLEDILPVLERRDKRPLEERVDMLEIAVSALKQRLHRLETRGDQE